MIVVFGAAQLCARLVLGVGRVRSLHAELRQQGSWRVLAEQRHSLLLLGLTPSRVGDRGGAVTSLRCSSVSFVKR